MGFPNRYDGACRDCGRKVAAGVCSRGAGGGWVTHCSACVTETPAAEAPPVVRARRAEGLTAQEWCLATRIACHYPGQIGEAPTVARQAA